MLKTSAYTFLLVLAGFLLAAAALVIPLSTAQEQERDLQDDLLRAQSAVQTELHAFALEHVASARTLAVHPALARALPNPPSPDELEPTPPPANPEEALKALPQRARFDLVALTDRDGNLLARLGEARPEVGKPIQGLPGVEQALQGIATEAVWTWPEDRSTWLIAASPILTWRGGEPQVNGVLLVGTLLDSNLATLLATPLRAQNRPGYSFDVALLRPGHLVASSVVDAELDTWLANITDAASLPPIADDAPRTQLSLLPQSQRHAGATIKTFAGTTAAPVGFAVVAARPRTTASPLVLAIQAFEAGIPPELLVQLGTTALIALGLFLGALFLMSLEHAAPGRRLHQALLHIEGDIESRDLQANSFHGVYRDAARTLLSVLTGLRKRLERERAAREASSLPPAPAEIAGVDSERTMDINAEDYARLVANLPPDASIPPNIAKALANTQGAPAKPAPAPAPTPSAADSATVESPIPAIPGLTQAAPAKPPQPQPPAAEPDPGLERSPESTMDMTSEQVERLMREVSSTTSTSSQQLAAIRRGARSLSSAQPQPQPPTEPTPSADASEEESGSIMPDFSIDSTGSIATRAVAESAWRKTDQPLTPHSLLGQLKQRTVVPPRRHPSAAVAEDTQVKQVSPDLLRRSSEFKTPEAEREQREMAQLFDEFIQTKQQCDEPLDGLTLERFIGRIERNRAKLIEQYQCSDVRFSVYVKNGKAALKATPVK